MGEAPQETFLPDLFQGLGDGASGRGFNRLPVKQAGIYLLDPTKTAPENWTKSCVITGPLVTALRGQEEFRTEKQSVFLQEGRTAVRKRRVLLVEEALAETIAEAPVQGAHRLQRATKTGAWLTVQLSTVHGTELGAHE